MEKIKNIAIIVLTAMVVISFFFGQRNGINYRKDDIKAMEERNSLLIKSNDSVKLKNAELDSKIIQFEKQIASNAKAVAKTETKIIYLNNKKNEVNIIVNNLPVNGVADELSNYLDKIRKDTSGH